mmetsp:Transcript_61113/g.155278  ORF Transcript_61113/g.155278 Transcript_61113/m.155278 type:complete len:216 (-) Transcript_61113:424-1071(-)
MKRADWTERLLSSVLKWPTSMPVALPLKLPQPSTKASRSTAPFLSTSMSLNKLQASLASIPEESSCACFFSSAKHVSNSLRVITPEASVPALLNIDLKFVLCVFLSFNTAVAIASGLFSAVNMAEWQTVPVMPLKTAKYTKPMKQVNRPVISGDTSPKTFAGSLQLTPPAMLWKSVNIAVSNDAQYSCKPDTTVGWRPSFSRKPATIWTINTPTT